MTLYEVLSKLYENGVTSGITYDFDNHDLPGRREILEMDDSRLRILRAGAAQVRYWSERTSFSRYALVTRFSVVRSLRGFVVSLRIRAPRGGR